MEKKIIINIPIEYKPLFRKDWREAAVYGGRYSLKSHTVARYLLIRAREEKTRALCCREFQNSISESSYQLLADLIKKYGLNDFKLTQNSIINTVTGSDFFFKGLWHNEQNIKSTEGVDVVWVEEAQTVSRKSLEVLTPTVRKPGSKLIYTYNRLLEEDPVHYRLVIEGRPKTLILNFNYDIAEKYGWMPEEIKNEIEDDKKNRPNLYKHKWLGEPINQELKIYSGWKWIDEVPREARLEKRWLDFGYTNDPTAIGELYYYNGGWILNELLYRKGMKNDQIAVFLNSLNKPETVIIADAAEPKSIDEIRSYGLSILPCKKGKDSVKSGIQVVQQQPIAATKSSTNIRKEYMNFLWRVDLNDKILNEPDPLCADNHMDGIRYALEKSGRLKQEASYWDRVFEEELTGGLKHNKFNKEC